MAANNPVPKIYRAVIEDVIKNVRESFLNEGVDEQVLNELKQLWENKLQQSRAIDVIPTDVNVRVSLTYPHTAQSGSATTSQQQQTTPKQTTQHQPQHTTQPVTATHIIRNPGPQQVVYVSNHPTLGHVGQMTGPAAQAAMALQNPANRGQPRAIIQQPLVHGQVIVQTAQGAQSIYQQFPGHVAGVHQRVIYAPVSAANHPATIAGAVAAQQQGQKPSGRVIQVDGTNDEISEATHNNPKVKKKTYPREVILQVDGPNDSDSDEEEDDEDYDNIPVAGIGGAAGGGELDELEGEEEEEPLNSEDDVSDDEEQTDFFDTDNVVVCQYDKIARTRNRWKFHLKDGIMNLNSKDFVFHKGTGDAEW